MEVRGGLQTRAQPPPAVMGGSVAGQVQFLEDRAMGVGTLVGRVFDAGAHYGGGLALCVVRLSLQCYAAGSASYVHTSCLFRNH